MLLKSMLAIGTILWNTTNKTRLVKTTGQIDGIVGRVDVVNRRGQINQTRGVVLHHLKVLSCKSVRNIHWVAGQCLGLTDAALVLRNVIGIILLLFLVTFGFFLGDSPDLLSDL